MSELTQPSQNLILRPTEREDVPAIMVMVNAAKAMLKADNSSQWQSGYPNEYSFYADIDAGSSFVLCEENAGQVVATASISFGEEAGYSALISGEWAYPEEEYGDYVVVHRVAVHPDYCGQHVADQLFLALFEVIIQQGIRTVRVDTHRKNQRMQNVLARLGFSVSGEITVDHDPLDTKRLCCEKLLR